MRPFIRYTAVLVTAGLLAACGDAPVASTAPTPSAPKKKVETVVAVNNASVEYTYNPVNKRDPFRNLMVETRVETSQGTQETGVVCAEPLCQFNLDELTVVAVVSGDANPLAMLEDRTGVGHLAHRNTKIGKNGGKVTQILRDCIVVTSFVTGPDGKAQPNKQNMCVRPDPGSAPVLDLLDGKLRQ